MKKKITVGHKTSGILMNKAASQVVRFKSIFMM